MIIPTGHLGSSHGLSRVVDSHSFAIARAQSSQIEHATGLCPQEAVVLPTRRLGPSHRLSAAVDVVSVTFGPAQSSQIDRWDRRRCGCWWRWTGGSDDDLSFLDVCYRIWLTGVVATEDQMQDSQA